MGKRTFLGDVGFVLGTFIAVVVFLPLVVIGFVVYLLMVFVAAFINALFGGE